MTQSRHPPHSVPPREADVKSFRMPKKYIEETIRFLKSRHVTSLRGRALRRHRTPPSFVSGCYLPISNQPQSQQQPHSSHHTHQPRSTLQNHSTHQAHSTQHAQSTSST
eukprot:GHVN01019873.1.p1 GENE.GHVN01019873.1~~GHVN01019873.1.p1  ORF type:complete len:109 (+),score=39.20 GHVN01019873.1:263-589(+)